LPGAISWLGETTPRARSRDLLFDPCRFIRQVREFGG
jgi:hypothetical protein